MLRKRHVFTRMNIIASVALMIFSIIKPPQANAQIGEAVGIGAKFLAGYAASRALDYGVDTVTGVPDVRELKRQLEFLAEQDVYHANALRELSYRLDEKMTREEVRTLVLETLNAIDARMAQLVRRIDEQQCELDAYARDLGLTQATVSLHGVRLDKQQERIDKLVEDYPRYEKFEEQAIDLGVDGFEHLRVGNHREALRAFRYAHAFDPTAPEHLYGQALAHYGMGDITAAEDSAAYAVVAERYRKTADWFRWSMVRVQGSDRLFLEGIRNDPITGTRPTRMRIPSISRDDLR